MPGNSDIERLLNELTQGLGAGASLGLGMNVPQLTQQIQKMSGALATVRDLFGGQNAPIAKLFESLEQLTQGSMHWMDGGNMEMMVRRVHAMSRNMVGSVQQFQALSQYGGGLAQSVGLDRSFGLQTAQSSMAFGHAFGSVAGRQGFGGLSKDEATGLDQQLRTAASASPMANSMGALMAMHEQGLIKEGTRAAELVRGIQSRDPTVMAQLSGMRPGDLMQVLHQSGVGGAAASTFLSAKTANQEQIHRHGLGDLVRGMQGQGEVAGFMRNQLQAGMMGSLRDSGLTQQQIAAILPRAAEAARQALMGMDGDLISNPDRAKERNAVIKDAIKAAIGDEAFNAIGPRIDELVATAVRQLEGSIGRSRSFGKFKNLAGLISLNKGDVHDKTHEALKQADADAAVASAMTGIDSGSALAKAIDAISGAGEGTNIADVVAKSLGGISGSIASSAMTPFLKKLSDDKGEFKRLHLALGKTHDPAEQEAIKKKMAELKKSIQAQSETIGTVGKAFGLDKPEAAPTGDRPAGGKGGAEGGGKDIRIRGTLIIKADGTGEFDSGPNPAGSVPR